MNYLSDPTEKLKESFLIHAPLIRLLTGPAES